MAHSQRKLDTSPAAVEAMLQRLSHAMLLAHNASMYGLVQVIQDAMALIIKLQAQNTAK